MSHYWSTPFTWLGPVFFFVAHFVLNLLKEQPSMSDRIYQSMLFTIAVELTTLFHAFGHIISGKMVKSSMDELLITTTRDVNIYHGDQSRLPGYVHLARSLGGPLFNLLVAGVCIFFSTKFSQGFTSNLLASLIGTNLSWHRQFSTHTICRWRSDLARDPSSIPCPLAEKKLAFCRDSQVCAAQKTSEVPEKSCMIGTGISECQPISGKILKKLKKALLSIYGKTWIASSFMGHAPAATLEMTRILIF
jgi:hypothetical protein